MRFVADSMLGRLAIWLRVLGYDTHYRSRYPDGVLEELIRQHHRLVTRNRARWGGCTDVVFVHSDHVGEQLRELFALLDLKPDPSRWLTRCLRCNTLLETACDEEAMEKVPEYVFYESHGKIKVCRSCERYFWPGSHRNRMMQQLKAWGLRDDNEL